MQKATKAVVAAVLVTLGVLGLGALGFIYSGLYNVAASEQHTALGRWVLQTVKVRSVKSRAGEVAVPQLISEAQRRQGAKHFMSMCVACHGAPGVERGEYGKGITPTPPDLSKAAGKWREEELFWILKNGIKLAGMPAFGETHSDSELWGIVSFVRTLPSMSEADYSQLRKEFDDAAGKSQASGKGHGH